jgi:hypothetical protein
MPAGKVIQRKKPAVKGLQDNELKIIGDRMGIEYANVK